MFLQIGLAKTEFEILDFQYNCEKARTENAMLFIPTGVVLPCDMRWGWTHKLTLDSCAYGDVISAEWIALLYMPNLGLDQLPDLCLVGKRNIGDAMAENNIAPELESNTHIRTSEIERTRGMKVIVRTPEGNWNLPCRSHLESFLRFRKSTILLPNGQRN